MTAFVFVLDPESVVIGMDTLAVRADDKASHMYASKILPLPHLGGVVCGTGSQRMALEWYLELQTMVLARDFDYVNEIASDQLRALWARLDEPGTSTIYHFGYSPPEDAYVGHAFRSTNDFVSERLDYGLGFRPVHDELVQIAPALYAELGAHEAVLRLIETARRLDDELPMSERVGVGGEVHMLTLTAGRQIGWATRPWSDFESTFEEMLERLGEENADG